MNFAPRALRIAGLVLCALLTLLFGLVPFLCGATVQALCPRRLPVPVAGPLAALGFLALWRATGWLPLTLGEGRPLWPSVFLSLWLFVAFFGAGATVLRDLWPRRFSPTSAA